MNNDLESQRKKNVVSAFKVFLKDLSETASFLKDWHSMISMLQSVYVILNHSPMQTNNINVALCFAGFEEFPCSRKI